MIKLSKQYFIDHALKIYADTGRFPDGKDWKRKNGFPCSSFKIYKLFGTWTDFKLACGVKPLAAWELTDDQLKIVCMEKFHELFADATQYPSSTTWRNNDSPCSVYTVESLFGSWKEFVGACGGPVVGCYNISREDLKPLLKSCILQYTEKYGTFPIYSKFKPENGFPCSYPIAMEIFGNAAALKRYVGWEDRYAVDSDQDMLKWIETQCEITSDDNSCWLWTGGQHDGYGQLDYNGTHWRIHRLTYTLAKGPIPKGLVVRHTCHNRICCRPDHLIVGTQADNIQDSIETRQFKSGPNNRKTTYGLGKLPTEKFIEYIKSESNITPEGCWEFPGATIMGYSVIGLHGKTYRLHRYMYAVANDIPYSGDWITRHFICDNRGCCNPDHLRSGDHSQNAMDTRGKSKAHKLTASKVCAIRNAWEEYTAVNTMGTKEAFYTTQAEIYNVSKACIRGIIRGHSWKGVGDNL